MKNKIIMKNKSFTTKIDVIWNIHRAFLRFKILKPGGQKKLPEKKKKTDVVGESFLSLQRCSFMQIEIDRKES